MSPMPGRYTFTFNLPYKFQIVAGADVYGGHTSQTR